MILRTEQADDHEAISDITAKAFRGVEHSDGSEPAIIARLREAGALALSLVAIEGGGIVGHIAFSAVTIDGRDCGWFGLGPVSVLPDRQRQGIGRALIEAGLAELRARGAAGCVLLGEPEYYRRFGFEVDGRLRYEGAPPEYFMSLGLAEENAPTGKVEYHPAFMGG